MYKSSSPEALSLSSLGRADSKRPETTCHGITVAGKPCRKPLKKGSRSKYCHLHMNQERSLRSNLVRKRETIVLGEHDERPGFEALKSQNEEERINAYRFGHSTTLVSPPLSSRMVPTRKPLQSPTVPAAENMPAPSMQLSTAPSTRPWPPTTHSSIHSTSPTPQNKSISFGKMIRKLFRHEKSKIPKYPHSLGNKLVPNDIGLPRYPQTTPPSAVPRSGSPIPIELQARLPHAKRRPPSIGGNLKGSNPVRPVKVPQVQCRSPTSALQLAQSGAAIYNGVQRSWETMWVPGIDGLGSHIICKGTLFSSCTFNHRMVKSRIKSRWKTKIVELYACATKCNRGIWLHLCL